uniref:VHS domain-containing protein n=1 Tax=Guillardia theta TaxID=55529 RepID=A0A7S4L5E2_GUITH|mmetsp:Transcript_37561/g.118544  ORF Transcript_37561/g.118544 Transcript_37561/m.118544 type:complete len:426 (+) Transcript_37561:26-1303(+)
MLLFFSLLALIVFLRAQQVVKAIRIRLTRSRPQVQLSALELAEVLVKNCGAELHQQVGSKHFMADLQSMATGEEVDAAVQRKCLELIQAWGEAFKSLQQTLPLFTATFNFLKAQGVEFPQFDASLAPQLSGKINLNEGAGSTSYGVMAPASHNPQASKVLPPVFMSELLKEDLEQVSIQCNLLVDMMNEAIVMKHDIRKNNILTELVRNCRIFQPRIMRLAEQVPDEDVIPLLLKINDDLINALNVYSSTLQEVNQREKNQKQKKLANQNAKKTIIWEPDGATTEEDTNLSMLLGIDNSSSLIPPPPSKSKSTAEVKADADLDALLGIDMQQSLPTVATSEAAGSQGGGSSEVSESQEHQQSLSATDKSHPASDSSLAGLSASPSSSLTAGTTTDDLTRVESKKDSREGADDDRVREDEGEKQHD